jgi:hypothetical protein
MTSAMRRSACTGMTLSKVKHKKMAPLTIAPTRRIGGSPKESDNPNAIWCRFKHGMKSALATSLPFRLGSAVLRRRGR